MKLSKVTSKVKVVFVFVSRGLPGCKQIPKGWIKRDQLDVTCFIISLFNAQHVSDVTTSILRSLRLMCWVISWVVLIWFDVCWCYVVVWLWWCGIRMQAEALNYQNDARSNKHKIFSVCLILNLFCYFLYMPYWLYYIFILHILKGKVFREKRYWT